MAPATRDLTTLVPPAFCGRYVVGVFATRRAGEHICERLISGGDDREAARRQARALMLRSPLAGAASYRVLDRQFGVFLPF